MSLRRLISVLGASVVAFGMAAGPLANAGPAKKKKDAAPAATPAAGSAAATPAATPAAGSGAGSAVQMTEDTPPADMEGTDENPDAPHAVGSETHVEAAAPVATRPVGYPIEEALRPITLPANMSEVSIDPHAQVSSFAGATALRARYGITSKIQLGLTYLLGGVFDQKMADPNLMSSKNVFQAGKAVGVDVTVLLEKWAAVRVGVPVYVDPVAVGLTIGVPLKFQFGDKYAIGGLDDLLSIRISKFAPSFYQALSNRAAAVNETNGTTQSRGDLRFSGYGEYQYRPNVVMIGRFGLDMQDFSSNRAANGYGGVATSIRFGIRWAPRHYLDVGGSIGFDDLADAGSFGPAGYLAFRI